MNHRYMPFGYYVKEGAVQTHFHTVCFRNVIEENRGNADA